RRRALFPQLQRYRLLSAADRRRPARRFRSLCRTLSLRGGYQVGHLCTRAGGVQKSVGPQVERRSLLQSEPVDQGPGLPNSDRRRDFGQGRGTMPLKVVILCGGLGTRIRDHHESLPKPMHPIGSKPIVWHIMKYYAHFGFKDFILCLGYKREAFIDFFLNYRYHNSDLTIDMTNPGSVQLR